MNKYSYRKGDLNMTKTIETEARASYRELLINGRPGLQVGEGPISYERQLESGELNSIDAEAAKRYLMSDEAYSIIEKEDDTCVDGRISVLTTKKQEDGSVLETDVSYIRPKVPGGGQHMVAVGMIGLGLIEENAQAQAYTAISFLLSHNIKYGAHTDTNASGDSCGCGAIDKFPAITQNVVLYRDKITDIITQIYDQVLNEVPNINIQNRVLDGFEEISSNSHFFDNYSGKNISIAIQDSGAVVKKLGDKHKEDYMVFNFVPGTTLNQKNLVQRTNNRVQAFCVDVWRMQQLAAALGSGNSDDELQAFYSMLDYGLGTFITLSDGTLPIIIRTN